MTQQGRTDPGNDAPTAELAARKVLDMADGLDRIMGDRALYARMLVRFKKDYQAGAAPIRAALDRGDSVLAHRIVHTLKGASGMIGARTVHGLACALERAIRTRSGSAPRELDTLGPALDHLLKVIDTRLNRLEPEEERALSLLLDDNAQLAHLSQLLRDGDGAAIDVLERAAPTLVAVLGVARYHEVSEAVHEFDFDGALAALSRTP